jgi:DNA mismatch repair protein MutS
VTNADAAAGTSPLIAQYLQLKAQYPEALLLSRVGDFYEAYGDDANELAQALNIVCTSKEAGKGQRVAMAGVPHHSVDHYLARLLRQLRIVAIAEQMEEPVPNRLVRRAIVRVLTPGTVLEEQFLDAERNNFLCAIATAAGRTAIAAIDVSTSQATVTVVDDDDALEAELDRLGPAEIVVATDEDAVRYRSFVSEACRVALCDPVEELEHGAPPAASGAVAPLSEISLAERPAAHEALELLQRYLRYLRMDAEGMLARVTVHEARETMALDRATRRHLDLLSGLGDNKQASLLNVLAKTKTAMGSRKLAQWLCAPLLDIAAINHRHEQVEAFLTHLALRVDLQRRLANIADVERIVQKIRARRASPRDVVGLRRSLESAATITAELEANPDSRFTRFAAALDPGGEAAAAAASIARALLDDPAPNLVDGGVMRPDCSDELQELIGLRSTGRQHLLALEEEVRTECRIKSLKIKYTQAFGYYYEVTRAQASSVPETFIRRQSLVNAERFTDARLKDLETRILSSRSQQMALERGLFEELLAAIDAQHDALLSCAQAIAELDVYCSLAQVAAERRYQRPRMIAGSSLLVEGGRHPIVEAYGSLDFVPNDCRVDAEHRFLLITGPNMGGKSTYLRQTALISILAQMGSFVPARRATLGVVDRLYTRIGAGDDIAAGRSTFYVEMAEMALILRHCTPRSLLLIDEVGRGTGTIDGLAIAQAISEYLLDLESALPMVLFATHFHELVKLAASYPHVDNLHVAVAEEATGPIFSHRLLPGSSSRSYGIAVANMAGLPARIVERAKEIAAQLELRPGVELAHAKQATRAKPAPERQLEIEMS